MPFQNPMKTTKNSTSADVKSIMPETKKRKLGTKTGETFLNKPNSAEEPHKKFASYVHKTIQRTGAWKPPLKMIALVPAKIQNQKGLSVKERTENIWNDRINLKEIKSFLDKNETEGNNEQEQKFITKSPIPENQFEQNMRRVEKTECFQKNFELRQTSTNAANNYLSESQSSLKATINLPIMENEPKICSAISEREEVKDVKRDSQGKEYTQLLDLTSTFDQQVDTTKELDTTPKPEFQANFDCRIEEGENVINLPGKNVTKNSTIKDSNILKGTSSENDTNYDDLKPHHQSEELNLPSLGDKKLEDKFIQRSLNCEFVTKQNREMTICSDEGVGIDKIGATAELSSEDDLDNIVSKTIDKYMNKEKLEHKLREKLSKEESSTESSPESSQETFILSPAKLKKCRPVSIKKYSPKNWANNPPISEFLDSYMKENRFPRKITSNSENTLAQLTNNHTENLQNMFITKKGISAVSSNFETNLTDTDETVILDSPVNSVVTFSGNYFNDHAKRQNESDCETQRGTPKPEKRPSICVLDKKQDKNTEFLQEMNIVLTRQKKNETAMKAFSKNEKVDTVTSNFIHHNYKILHERINNDKFSKISHDSEAANIKSNDNDLQNDRQNVQEKPFETDDYILKFQEDDETDLFLRIQENDNLATMPSRIGENQAEKFESNFDTDLTNFNLAAKVSNQNENVRNHFPNQLDLKNQDTVQQTLDISQQIVYRDHPVVPSHDSNHTRVNDVSKNSLNGKLDKENNLVLNNQKTFQQQISAVRKQTNVHQDTPGFDTNNPSMNEVSTNSDNRESSQVGGLIKDSIHETQLVAQSSSGLKAERAILNYFSENTDMISYNNQSEQHVANICSKLDVASSNSLVLTPYSFDGSELNYLSQKNEHSNLSKLTPDKFFRTFSDLYTDKCVIEDDFNTEENEGEPSTNYYSSKDDIVTDPSLNMKEHRNIPRPSTNQNKFSSDKERTLDHPQNTSIIDSGHSKCLPFERCQSVLNTKPLHKNYDLNHFDLPSSSDVLEPLSLASEEISSTAEENLAKKTSPDKNQEKILEHLRVLNGLMYQKEKERQKKIDDIRNLVFVTNALVYDMIELFKSKTLD